MAEKLLTASLALFFFVIFEFKVDAGVEGRLLELQQVIETRCSSLL